MSLEFRVCYRQRASSTARQPIKTAMTGLDTCRALELRCRKSPIELMLFEPLPSGVALGTSAMGWRHHTKGRIGRPLETLLISCKSSACWYFSDRWLAQCIAFASESKCVGPVRPDCKEHLEQQFIGNTPIVAISSSPILASNLSKFAGPKREHRRGTAILNRRVVGAL